jgi:hypothetical protein
LEQFTRDCLETDSGEKPGINLEENSMDRVYEKAVSLAKRTLSVDGAVVVDISSFHTAEKTHRKDSMTATVYYSEDLDRRNARPQVSLSEGDYDIVVNFFQRFPDGHIYHDRFPLPFMQHVLPQRVQYALVPVYHGTGQIPSALLCVHTQQPKRFLERFGMYGLIWLKSFTDTLVQISFIFAQLVSFYSPRFSSAKCRLRIGQRPCLFQSEPLQRLVESHTKPIHFISFQY